MVLLIIIMSYREIFQELNFVLYFIFQTVYLPTFYINQFIFYLIFFCETIFDWFPLSLMHGEVEGRGKAGCLMDSLRQLMGLSLVFALVRVILSQGFMSI